MIFSFFVYQGWIEIGIFATLYRDVLHSTKRQAIDDSYKTSRNAEERAKVEESRRQEEKQMLRRSVSVAARNFNMNSSNNSVASGIGGRAAQSNSVSSLGSSSVLGRKSKESTGNPLNEKLVSTDSLGTIEEHEEIDDRFST
ncbi:hypothetical protein EON65_38200 [archaeon]|nr:MAG: hypothetical protein EON65_38200 [archaeon]